MNTEHNRAFMTVDEAAQLAGVTHWTVRLWLHKGKLTRYKSGQHPLIRRTELNELLRPRKAEMVGQR
jgi:excisionase family DNA binding protein